MADPTLSSLERWNTRYSADGFLFGQAPNRFLAQRQHLFQAGQKVLCPADGEGRNSTWLAGLNLTVDAFDISDVGIEKARAWSAHNGVHVSYRVCGVDDWPWTAAHYDAVAAIFLQFAPPAQRAHLFRHCIDTLKPGGLMILLGYTPKQLQYRTGGPSDIEHLYTRELLEDTFGAEMDIAEMTEFEEVLTEGTGHAGQSAMIGMVARKR